MRVLILGDPNKYFRLEYVNQMRRQYPEIQFDIASTEADIPQVHTYAKIFYIPYKGIKSRLSKIISLRRSLKKLCKYDYIHIHSANITWLLVMDILKKKSSKVILTYYGSDYYRTQQYKLWIFKIYNWLVDEITFTSKRMQYDVLRKNRKILVKSRVIKFGVDVFNSIDRKLTRGKKKFKKESDINPEHIVLTVGYNATKEQNHIEVLNILEKIKTSKMLPDFTVVLPLNYGDEKYKEFLLDNINYSYPIVVSTEFLTHDKISELRCLSDIMIHVQNSDQFSSSVLEYIYAGNVLINGTWLEYIELKEWGIKFEEVGSVSMLNEKIVEVVQSLGSYKNFDYDRRILKQKMTWESVCSEWRSLYNNE